MPTPITCACGKNLRVPEEFAGRRVRCPGCSETLLVPAVDAEESAGSYLLADPPQPEKPKKGFDSERDDEDDRYSDERRPKARYPRDRDEELPARGRRPLRDEDPDDDLVRRIRRDDRPERVASRGAGGGWLGGINAGVGGGLASMAIAVVWFFGGLAVGYIFFYPPILFIIGFIAFIKGLAGGDR